MSATPFSTPKHPKTAKTPPAGPFPVPARCGERNERKTAYHRAALLCKAWNQFLDNDRKKLTSRRRAAGDVPVPR